MRTICGSSLLSIAMSGVRERMMASRSRSGLSVSSDLVAPNVEDGKFKVLKPRALVAGFKEKIWNYQINLTRLPHGYISSSGD